AAPSLESQARAASASVGPGGKIRDARSSPSRGHMRFRFPVLLRIAPILLLAAAAAPAAAKGDDASDKSIETRSQLGSYLAGRFASKQHDAPAASVFYGKAWQQAPANAVLLDYAFQMEASQGNWPRVEVLARELVTVQPSHR